MGLEWREEIGTGSWGWGWRSLPDYGASILCGLGHSHMAGPPSADPPEMRVRWVSLAETGKSFPVLCEAAAAV